ncbi:uncharacterized protein PG986_005780 [Apiospora aurea]|uniref:Uncharacterized protein n=1 Tax=Apiospora aurea TaxID=335848 RepID=A0ABR1QIJ3_9PEZI
MGVVVYAKIGPYYPRIFPYCTWIDHDHSNDIKAAVIGINWSALHTSNDETNAPDKATAKQECGKNMQAWRNWNTEQLLSLPEGPAMVRRSGKRSLRNPTQVITWGGEKSPNARL